METTNFNNYPLVDLYTNYMLIISRTLKMRTGYQLITTKYHMSYPIMSIDFTTFSDNLISLGITEEILIYRILSEEKYSSLSESERKNQAYNHPELLNIQFAIACLSLPQLFELSFFHEYILKCTEIELSRNIIFIIEDIKYLELLATLKFNNIVLVGGSNNYQHIMTPVRFRISQIIASIENGRQRGVNNSYHLPNKKELYGGQMILESTKPNLNWIAMQLAEHKNKKS